MLYKCYANFFVLAGTQVVLRGAEKKYNQRPLSSIVQQISKLQLGFYMSLSGGFVLSYHDYACKWSILTLGCYCSLTL